MKTKDTRLYDLAYLIRMRRIELGYSSAEKFSNEKGINRSVYQRWESGEDLNLTSFLKLCDMHHISASALLLKWEQTNRLMPKDNQIN
ncbi:MAG: hypothetical protein RI934_1028 [Bacteroidota bacterium]|jgi:transcriptional regulator with XRE-family HTH domain